MEKSQNCLRHTLTQTYASVYNGNHGPYVNRFRLKVYVPLILSRTELDICLLAQPTDGRVRHLATTWLRYISMRVSSTLLSHRFPCLFQSGVNYRAGLSSSRDIGKQSIFGAQLSNLSTYRKTAIGRPQCLPNGSKLI